MPELKDNPTMKDYQAYVAELVEERGFADETVPEIFILFVEEVGELARAIFTDTDKPEVRLEKISHEVSDLFTYLLDIANHYDADVERVFRKQYENQASSLKLSPALRDYQEFIGHSKGRGHPSTEGTAQIVIGFVSEVGELARSIRKSVGVKIDRSVEAKYRAVDTQIANCFSYIVMIANALRIDIEQAFRAKEELNRARFWSRAKDKSG